VGLIRFGLLLLLIRFMSSAWAASGAVTGRVSDASLGGLDAEIHLIRREPYLHLKTKASADGRFHLEQVEPGTYMVRAWKQGFRANPMREITLAEGEERDLGEIRLELSGCDAPGVICDYVGAEPPDTSITSAHISLRAGGRYELDKTSVKPGKPDIELRADGPALFIAGINGAVLTRPNGGDIACRGEYSQEPVRIDGLGAGYDICVRTSEGRYSRIFLTHDIEPGSREAAIWFVTRR
jgi:Carboxypeptidase regulatory-like domain